MFHRTRILLQPRALLSKYSSKGEGGVEQGTTWAWALPETGRGLSCGCEGPPSTEARRHRGPAPQRPGATKAQGHVRPQTPRLGCGRIWAKKPAGLGYRGQKSLGFGLPWAKITWVWATMGKICLGLGYYGHRIPAGLGYRGQKSLGFGLPWAKKHLGLGYHGQKITWVWATMGKVYLGLGYYGHKHPRVWATMGKNLC